MGLLPHKALIVLCFSVLLAVSLGRLSTICHASSEIETKDEAVVTLTKDNFDSFLENEVVLVEFFAPWCGHCKKLHPEYEKAAQTLKGRSKVKLGKVDATAEADLADKYGVRGYPTLHFFRNKVPEEYTGGRTADTIVEWIHKMTGPAVTEHTSEDLRRLRDSKPSTAFIGTLKKGSDLHQMFDKRADASRHAGKFVVSFIEDGAESVVVVRGDEEEVSYSGKTETDLKNFVTEESFALFGPINGENFKNYAERSQEIVWFCGEEKDFDEMKGPVREAAKKYRTEYSFVWLDTDQFKGHAENALSVTTFPALVYQSKKGRYILPDNSHLNDGGKIIQFIEDVRGGKIEKSLKSEPIPEKSDELVKVVVGKTFEQIVTQKDKDVMLEVYAPWCGHCKKLEPVFKELAEKLQNVSHIVMAKMDGTANEAPLEDFDWTGFPTLFFIKAGSTTPMRFDGGRTVEGMMEYIKKHSSHPIKDEHLQETKAADRAEEL